MNLKLRYNLWRSRRGLSPSRDFRRRLLHTLRAQMAAPALLNVPWYQRHRFRFALASLAGLVTLATGGTGVYAYVSPDVTDGTPLYPVKQTLEKVEEKLQNTPEKKAEFYLKKIARREAEAQVLAARQRPVEKTDTEIDQLEEKLEHETVKISHQVLRQEKKLRENIVVRLTERQNRRRQKVVAASTTLPVVNSIGVVATEDIVAVSDLTTSSARHKKKNIQPLGREHAAPEGDDDSSSPLETIDQKLERLLEREEPRDRAASSTTSTVRHRGLRLRPARH